MDEVTQLRNLIGAESSFAGADEVTSSDFRRKLEVYCFDCPLHYEMASARLAGYRTVVAPVSMTPLWAMHSYWQQGDPSPWAPGVAEKSGADYLAVSHVFAEGFNAEFAAEYYEPLYPGDLLHGSSSLIDVKPRRTRLGDGAFLKFETRLWKQDNTLVAVLGNTIYRYNPSLAQPEQDHASFAVDRPPPAGSCDPEQNPTIDWNQRIALESVTVGDEVPPFRFWLSYQRLVMSVAADRMFSSIHYDRYAARRAGFRDVIFNSRGYQTLIEVALRRWMGLAGRVRSMGPFRMTSSSYPGDLLITRGRVVDKTNSGDVTVLRLDMSVRNDRAEVLRGNTEIVINRA